MYIINKDIDPFIFTFLHIDNLRSLYQVNHYMRKLLTHRLANFIKFYSIITSIHLPWWIKNNLSFNKAILFGDIDVCIYIYRKFTINIHDNDEESFQLCCCCGHLDIAQWLFSLGNVNIHIDSDNPFQWCCQYGHLDVAKWLFSLGNIKFRSGNHYAFRLSCLNNHIHVAQWLCSIEPLYHIELAQNSINCSIKVTLY